MCRRRSQHRIWLVAGPPAPCQMLFAGRSPYPLHTNGGNMRKNKQFSIRISEQDLETIRRKAAQAHMSQSDYVTACCLGKRVARTSAQRGALRHSCAHTRCRGRKPHTAATRASRHGAGARHTRRVDRADCFHGQKIGTIGTFEGNPPFAVAAVRLC